MIHAKTARAPTHATTTRDTSWGLARYRLRPLLATVTLDDFAISRRCPENAIVAAVNTPLPSRAAALVASQAPPSQRSGPPTALPSEPERSSRKPQNRPVIIRCVWGDGRPGGGSNHGVTEKKGGLAARRRAAARPPITPTASVGLDASITCAPIVLGVDCG